MKQNTNNTNETENLEALEDVDSSTLASDFKHSLLIVSLLANAFVLIGWVALQVTTIYDYQVAAFLFYR